MKSNVFCDMT